MNYFKLLKNFILTALTGLFICAVIVLIVDPFFHYHKPIGGLKAVLTDKEYQCIGTLKNFDYNALVVGSSVCENYNNHWFDEKFDVTTIKAVRSYGATADLIYMLNAAYEDHNIEKIFYNIDPTALMGKPHLTFEESGCPMYLFDDNPVNDISYLLNKDILFRKIPNMITKSYFVDYDEGESFNWAKTKLFGPDQVFMHYTRQRDVYPMKDKDYLLDECLENIELINGLVTSHPETEFYFFIPPYSFVWFDSVYRNGNTDACVNNMKTCLNSLIENDNVHAYCFIDDENVVTNLDNYMDALHFTEEINHYVVDNLGEANAEITKDNIETRFENLREYAYRASEKLMLDYEERLQTAVE